MIHNFQVSFLDTGTDNVHKHIDYAFIIEDREGREIFNAAPPGQSTLHTAEGVITIPYRFQEKGDYTVNVILYGVDFITTIPQVARFPCNDIPEFPLGMMGLFAGIIATTIVISRYFETRRMRSRLHLGYQKLSQNRIPLPLMLELRSWCFLQFRRVFQHVC
jgi:hypothetical protein